MAPKLHYPLERAFPSAARLGVVMAIPANLSAATTWPSVNRRSGFTRSGSWDLAESFGPGSSPYPELEGDRFNPDPVENPYGYDLGY